MKRHGTSFCTPYADYPHAAAPPAPVNDSFRNVWEREQISALADNTLALDNLNYPARLSHKESANSISAAVSRLAALHAAHSRCDVERRRHVATPTRMGGAGLHRGTSSPFEPSMRISNVESPNAGRSHSDLRSARDAKSCRRSSAPLQRPSVGKAAGPYRYAPLLHTVPTHRHYAPSLHPVTIRRYDTPLLYIVTSRSAGRWSSPLLCTVTSRSAGRWSSPLQRRAPLAPRPSCRKLPPLPANQPSAISRRP